MLQQGGELNHGRFRKSWPRFHTEVWTVWCFTKLQNLPVCWLCQYKSRQDTDAQIPTIPTSVFIYRTATSIWVENWNPVYCNTLGVVRAWTLENTNTHYKKTFRGVWGGEEGSRSWHAKPWRLPKARGTISIVPWALFSRYNHCAAPWKHGLHPNESPWNWRDFTWFLFTSLATNTPWANVGSLLKLIKSSWKY